MGPAFLASYVLLAALLAGESVVLHAMLRKSAGLRKARRQRQEDAAARRLQRVPPFQGKLLGADGDITAPDLGGKPTALLFVDQDAESQASKRDIHVLLRRTHEDRRVGIFVGTRRDEASLDTTALHEIKEKFRFPGLTLVHDRDFTIARDFRIDTYPTLLLVGPDGKVERIWTNLSVCHQTGRQAPGGPEGPAAAPAPAGAPAEARR